MKNILIITSADLRNPKSGTPIRILNFISQIQKGSFTVTLVANDCANLDVLFVQQPSFGKFKNFFFYRKLIIDKKIDWIFTPTLSDIKMAILLKLATNTKLVTDIHGLSYEEDYHFGRINLITKFAYRFLQLFYLRFCNKIFVVSEKMFNYFKLDRGTGTIIHGGVSLDEFPCVARYVKNSPNIPFEITYMGNARDYQGLPILLDAIQSFNKTKPSFILRLILSSDADKVSEMLEKRGLFDHSVIHNGINHTEVYTLLRTTDTLVIPRPSLVLTEYAYPSKLPECMATGVPIVTTDVGPVKEFLVNGINCIIVPPDDVEALAEGIQQIYALSPDSRRSVGTKAREYAEQHLQWESLGVTIRSVFNEVD